VLVGFATSTKPKFPLTIQHVTHNLAKSRGDRDVLLVDCSMAKKQIIPEKYQAWIEVRKRYHLSHAHIQMARELGMNPKKLGKIANQTQEPWKTPLPVFIEELHSKRFGTRRPDTVHSSEQRAKEKEKKKAKRRRLTQRNKTNRGAAGIATTRRTG